MGNKIARTTQVSSTEYYLHDLPSSYNLVLIEVLERGRFFKSILCKHDEGLVLVKVYFKRGDSLDLKEYERRLGEIRDAFRSVQDTHIWPFQFWLETDKAAYLLRQYFFSNLYDRMTTQPSLSLIEKKWLAFQLLCAVKQSHEKGICHGDIKCENVLVTSWNWLYLVDFASFKPTYIPDDDPSDFSFFFDTGGRRRCYIAPERFYEHGGEVQISSDAALKPSMDIFSLGCVIAELFLGRQSLFELSQLLAYRRGQYDPTQSLEKIQDAGIRNMVLHMIQLDPDSRLSCESYLQSYASVVFPNYFSPFLHKFFSCMIPLDSDTRVAVTQSAFQEIHKQMISDKLTEILFESCTDSSPASNEASQNIESGKQSLDSYSGSLRNRGAECRLVDDQSPLVRGIASLLNEVEDRHHHSPTKVELNNNLSAWPHFGDKDSLHAQGTKHTIERSPNDLIRTSRGYGVKESPLLQKILKSDLNSLLAGYDGELDASKMPLSPETECKLNCDGMILIASLLCSCIRSVKQPQLRREGVLLLKSCSLYIQDEDRLQHVLPYVIAMLSDPAAIVRCAALETLCDILPLVRAFPPSEAKIFPEYILPMLSMLPDDQEESVRICYTSNIFKIALTAYRLLIQLQSSPGAGLVDKSTPPERPQSPMESSGKKKLGDSVDAQLSKLRKSVAEVIQELVMGTKQTPNIRRALLQDIGHLCYFFGQKESNDFLLPILPAFLNDRDEQLRAVFYGQIIFVCYFVGQRSVEEYLLPYIEQALSDPMEAVIVNGLQCLTMLCRNGFLRKKTLLVMIEQAFPLLCYPVQWVRRSAVTFIAASSESLGPIDSYVYLSPVLRRFVHREPASLSSVTSLLSCLKPPVSKLVLYQVLENARSADMLERQRKIWYNSPGQLETVEHSRRVLGDPNPMKSSNGKESNPQGGKYANSITQKSYSPISEDVSQIKPGGSFYSTSGADVKDSVSSDKLLFSGLISPHVSAGTSFLCDGPSEGIPVYSFFTDKRSAGAVAGGVDSSLHRNSLGIGSSSTPWLDTVNKSIGLSASVPPKLISGSFLNVSNYSKHMSRSTQDVETKENDQSAYVTSRFQDVSLSDALKGSSYIAGDDASSSDIGGLQSFARASSVPDTGWRPRGVLVAHLQEHRSAVNDITISADHSFFVTVSDDSTVKIWDTRKLEKDISFRSRLTYSLDGCKALCATMLRGTAQVVVGASNGTVNLFSVDYISRGLDSVVERYSGIVEIKKKEVGEGAVLSLFNCSTDSCISKTVLYSTQRCGIHLWDTRTNSEAWASKVVPEEGYISSLVMGHCGNWFVSGSSRGVLKLWDMRFLLPVNSWQYSAVSPVEKISLFIPPSNSNSATARPLVYVAAGCNEVCLWNAENGSCHQVYRMPSGESDYHIPNSQLAAGRPSKPSPKQDLKQNAKSKYRTGELQEPFPRFPGARSLLPLPGGDLLTGGTDLKIRYWDHTSPGRSYSVCGPSTKGIGNDEYYDIRSNFGVQIVQELNKRPAASKLTQKALLAAAAADSAGCHRDSILSLASVKLNQRLLLSGSRDGAIKVWK